MSAYRNLYRLPRILSYVSAGRSGHLASSQHHLLIRDDGFRSSTSSSASVLGETGPINHETAVTVVAKLTNSERQALRLALSKFEASPLVSSQQLEGKHTRN